MRADMICIIQSTPHKCVLAPVTPPGPEVLSHRAQEAPHAEPPPRPSLHRHTIRDGCCCPWKETINSQASYGSFGVSLKYRMDEDCRLILPSALALFSVFLIIQSDYLRLIKCGFFAAEGSRLISQLNLEFQKRKEKRGIKQVCLLQMKPLH